MIDEFVVWCAGFFDGEGSVCIPLGKRGPEQTPTQQQHWLQVTVTQNRREPLLLIRERFGGRVTLVRQPPDKRLTRPVWRWIGDGPTGAAFLSAVLPHSRVKRAAAEVGLEFQATIVRRPVSHAKLAAGLGLSRDTVRNFIAGRKVRPENAERIRAALAATPYLHRTRDFARLWQDRQAIKERLERINAGREG